MPQTSITELLMYEMSRRHTDYVVRLLENSDSLFDDLWGVFLGPVEVHARRAAWALDLFTMKHPQALAGKTESIIQALGGFTHGGLHRHALKMLQRLPFESSPLAGQLASFCFDGLVSNLTPVAVQAHCMDILYRLTLVEPDLARELSDCIKMGMTTGSPGYKSHGRKILQSLGQSS